MTESETDLGPMGHAQAQEIDGLPASIVGGLLGDALGVPGGPGSEGPPKSPRLDGLLPGPPPRQAPRPFPWAVAKAFGDFH